MVSTWRNRIVGTQVVSSSTLKHGLKLNNTNNVVAGNFGFVPEVLAFAHAA